MDSKQLFKKRFSAHLKETVRYLQYILNGHLAIAILFLLGAGAVFYQQFLTQLPDNFPTDWIVSLLFALVALYNPIQNLLKEADLVFLFPAEKKLTPYFNLTLWYSFLTQLYLVAIVAAALAPLYQTSELTESYQLLLLMLVFFKAWHFLLNWWILRVRDRAIQRSEKLLRFLLQLAFFYSFINRHVLIASLLAVGLIGLFVYLYYYSHRFALAWDQLVEKDQQRMQSFYRLASMFTDVPHFKTSIKKRRLLVGWLTKAIPFEQKNSYSFLYRITLSRSADYFGLYLRLTLIGAMLLAYFDHILIVLVVSMLFLYITGIQLVPLWYHHRTQIWGDLYPIKMTERKDAIIKLIEQLLALQLIVFTLVSLLTTDLWQSGSVLLIGIVFITGFSRIYVMKKLT
ncbi:ABC transporter permease [Amphibacillus indicireducens]|uniref:ABC transporter permease EcsB n=1 Tax=Amphibacillus indicireducens TaxID=1076330 RepID=A0ABP7V6C4_9BACI